MLESLYGRPFFISFLLSIVFLWAIIFLLPRVVKFSDRRLSLRHIHPKGVSRLGGMGMIVAAVVTILLDRHLVMTTPLMGLVVASGGILVIGLWDDFFELSWKWQLAFQVMLALFIFYMGVRLLSFSLPWGGAVFFDDIRYIWVSLVLSVLWILLVVNALNWADGVDGLCGGIALIGFVTIFLVSLKPEVFQPSVAIMAATLLGATLGFLVFNMHPAKVLAGTSGSWFLGFTLAVLALFSGAKVATTLLVLALPVIDAAWVVFDRFRSGVSIFQPDGRHLHYRLREIGWSHTRIVLFFYGLTAFIAYIALRAHAWGKMIALTVIGAGMVLFAWWVEEQRKERSDI